MSARTTTERIADARPVASVIDGQASVDGDGVRLTRYIGSRELNTLDPFLLLDLFESDRPDDYIGGFPPHPHRGFETVTYLLDGRMRHEDSAGHAGVIEPGGVQWMTAGRGIVHSEMPEQEQGRLAGFQLWVNLPAARKMSAPAYQEFPAAGIATESRDDGVAARVVAGETSRGTPGPVRDIATGPLYLDVSLPGGSQFDETLPETDNAFVFVIEGSLKVLAGEPVQDREINAKQLAVLGPGSSVQIEAGETDSRFLLISGRPIGEPIARGGPFVMNTRAEVLQAFDDYQSGRF